MNHVKVFLEKIENDENLKEKYDEIINKHLVSRDKDAVAEELTQLAIKEGFEVTSSDIINAFTIDFAKGELTQEQLESVSGGGSGLSICAYDVSIILHGVSSDRRETNVKGVWETLCTYHKNLVCSWAGCRCWGTKHCKDSYHLTDENGKSLSWHGLTS